MSEQAKQEIRELIERWAAAVHEGDIDAVEADHAADIVMFDVPPPEDGVRGIAAYRETWPPFFAWQAQGALFEIVHLDVTAGEEVAYAEALVRCGTEADLTDAPDRRLRLTLGLRREEERWIVAHEHHSFTDDSFAQREVAREEVAAVHEELFRATREKDLDRLMAQIADEVVSYEHDAPLQYTDRDAIRKICRQGLESAPGTVTWDVPDLTIFAWEDHAIAWGLNRVTAQRGDGEIAESWSRGTRFFEKHDGVWKIAHQHLSYPYDPETGEANTGLRP